MTPRADLSILRQKHNLTVATTTPRRAKQNPALRRRSLIITEDIGKPEPSLVYSMATDLLSKAGADPKGKMRSTLRKRFGHRLRSTYEPDAESRNHATNLGGLHLDQFRPKECSYRENISPRSIIWRNSPKKPVRSPEKIVMPSDSRRYSILAP